MKLFLNIGSTFIIALCVWLIIVCAKASDKLPLGTPGYESQNMAYGAIMLMAGITAGALLYGIIVRLGE